MSKLQTFFLTIVCLSINFLPIYAQSTPDHISGTYYTIVDVATGQILLETGMSVEVDDQLISEDDKLYQVTSVEHQIAYAKFLSHENHSMQFSTDVVPATTVQAQAASKLIGVYHTHTDESYTPTDGKPSIRGNGTIMKVGEAFAEKLRSMGYTVNQDKTLHDPHDPNAYIRSRRTAMRLLSEQPAALFDIHRNSAPAAAYKLTTDGTQVARVVLVVGRANQFLPTTHDFAKRLKAASDKLHPKLVRGIFFARGHYNQDINPRAILVEIGTEGSTLGEAERGAALFADAIPLVLGGAQDPTPDIGGTTAQASPGDDGGGSIFEANSPFIRNLLWMIGITTISSIAYLYISSGSWHAVGQKLQQFRNLEFANLIGLSFRRNKHDKDKE
jgi:stage II sporulation protein P